MSLDIEKKKFFVVGSSRSGTTMMGRILNNHPDIFTFHELHFFEKINRQYYLFFEDSNYLLD